VVGVVVALLIIAFGVNGLQLVGVPFWGTETFQGAALLVAVVLSKLPARNT
jgi:ribose transport system permease protein